MIKLTHSTLERAIKSDNNVKKGSESKELSFLNQEMPLSSVHSITVFNYFPETNAII